MLFNSYEFIFIFLPLVLFGFQLARRLGYNAAIVFLIFVSLIFYAWWRPINLLIIVPSIFVNYILAKTLLRYAEYEGKARVRNFLLTIGIISNLLFLGYFKYLTFFQGTSNDLFGTDFVLTYIILPLGISFITFQKIAFLVDVHGGGIKAFKFREFALFVLFFPQLIAGPIVHFREMVPQYRQLGIRIDRNMLALGISLFCIGLFKKAVLADGIAIHVTPVFDAAAAGQVITLTYAWIAAIGFTLQIYFDFAGYSDMAAGLALAIGLRLPVNFDSPLKSCNIIDFWARWHITLTRFLTAYVYNPIALYGTRRRLGKGLGGFNPNNPKFTAFLTLLAAPTFLTMLLSGLWHGAGYTFIVWGALHGAYLCINHGWRLIAPKRFSSRETYEKWMRPVGFVITFLSVTFAMVWFRAESVGSALELSKAMAGTNGIGIPEKIVGMIGLENMSFIIPEAVSLLEFFTTVAWVIALLVVALLLPNGFQFLAAYEPVLGYKLKDNPSSRVAAKLSWQPSLPWFLIISVLLISAVLRVGGQSEFLYWQF